jgi:hypothetical protein
MKSNRMRLYSPPTQLRERINAFECGSGIPISLAALPAPLPINKVAPDQLIEDILLATLRRVQENSSPEVAAAAARYITLLSENAL